jgi:hypothetical protein
MALKSCMQCSCGAWGSNSPLLGQCATLLSEPAVNSTCQWPRDRSARVAVAVCEAAGGGKPVRARRCMSCVCMVTNFSADFHGRISQSLDVDSVWSTGQHKWAAGKLTLARLENSRTCLPRTCLLSPQAQPSPLPRSLFLFAAAGREYGQDTFILMQSSGKSPMHSPANGSYECSLTRIVKCNGGERGSIHGADTRRARG